MRKRTWQRLVLVWLSLGVGLVAWAGHQALKDEAPVASPLVAPSLSQSVPLPLESEQAKPNRSKSKPYRFVALGDWGAGTSFQKDVAAQMIRLYQKQPYDVVLTLGDNIYEDGNVKKHGKAYFTDMYAPLIAEGVKFVVAIGNHDIKGGYQHDQLEFFKMPGYYYTVKRGPIAYFVLNTNTFHEDEVQQKWLDRALAESTASWKVVLGHHPIYSSGEHGNRPALQKTLEPILVRHKVDFYLAGHDHEYERFAPKQGVQHIVSGGGGAYLRGFEKINPHSQVRIKAHHFLSFELKGDTMTMRVIDKTGQCIDQATWSKPVGKPLKPAAQAS